MNSKERMLAVLEGKKVDHIPCSFMLFYNLYDDCKSELEYITREVELGLEPHVHAGHLNHTMHLTGTLHPEATYREWTEVKDGVKYFCRKIDTPKGPLTSRVKQWDGWPTEGDFPIFKDWIVPRSQEFLVKPEQDLEKLKYIFGPFKDSDIEKLRKRPAQRNPSPISSACSWWEVGKAMSAPPCRWTRASWVAMPWPGSRVTRRSWSYRSLSRT